MENEKDQKFRESKQEPLRLKIALERLFETEDPELKQQYREYLKMRFRPAMEQLIEEEDIKKLQALLELKMPDVRSLDRLIRLAGEHGKIEAANELLCVKREVYGFHEKSFEL